MKKLLITIALLGFSFIQSKSQVKSIPDFTFSRMDNGTDFKPANLIPGQKSLIVFFDTECSHCMEAITEYNNKEKILNNLNIILVTRDAKAQVDPFLKKYGPKISVRKNTTILSDKYNQFIAKFLPRKYPSMFLFDVNRKLMIYSDEEKDIPVILNKISGN
jgi:thioredoxin-related protein